MKCLPCWSIFLFWHLVFLQHSQSKAFLPPPPLSQRSRPPSAIADTPSNNNPEDVTTETPSSFFVSLAASAASGVVLYSEYTLKTTGCGLPAGPGGLVGAVEGVSYLGVLANAGGCLYSRVQRGSTFPGNTVSSEGVSYFAIVVGLVVLSFQLTDYGYIPNAVPMEGGMCQ